MYLKSRILRAVMMMTIVARDKKRKMERVHCVGLHREMKGWGKKGETPADSWEGQEVKVVIEAEAAATASPGGHR